MRSAEAQGRESPRPTSTEPEERLAAWTLATAPSLPPREALTLVREAGSCREALERLRARLPARRIHAAERSFDRAAELGYRILAVTERDYPRLLAQIPDPPLALSLWGSLLADDALGVAVVGSRRATAYGVRTSRRLARELAGAGLTIVSGLARGVDRAAHEGALDARGRTLAVLGSGLARLYPREHGRLARAIAERGCLVSEFDLDEPPRPHNFPRRNRVITGLTLGTVVVEAARKSGSLVSARHAMEQNREVFAVPGPVTSPTSDGVHDLLRDGAKLVTGAPDVLDELHPDVRNAIALREPAAGSADGAEARDSDEKLLLDRLSRSSGAVDVDALVGATGLSVGRALAALTQLEMNGHVVALPGGLYRSTI